MNFKISSFYLIFSFSLLILQPISAEIFKLKNGQIIKGKLERTDDNYYYIKFSIGVNSLAKEDVSSVEQEKEELSASEKFNVLSASAETKEKLIEAADLGLEKGYYSKALVLLKRAYSMDSSKDEKLAEKIKNIETSYSVETLKKAKDYLEAGKPTLAATVLNNSIRDHMLSGNTQEVLDLKVEIYKNLLSEEDSFKFLDKTLENFSPLEIKASAGSAASQAASSSQKSDIDLQTLKKVNPSYISLVNLINKIFQIREYIMKNTLNDYAKKNIYSKADLDASRADQKKFNSLCAENNKIYKARNICRQYNQVLYESKSQLKTLKLQLDKEQSFWTGKGYEKVNGEWLSGDAVKKAKGLVFYRKEWLDPKAVNFQAKMAEIDSQILAEQEAVLKKEQSFKNNEQKSPVLHPAMLPPKEAPSKLSSSDDDLLKRTPKEMANQVKTALKEEAERHVSEVKEKANRFSNQMNVIQTEVTEQTKGIPIPLGIGLILAAVILLKFLKRKK